MFTTEDLIPSSEHASSTRLWAYCQGKL